MHSLEEMLPGNPSLIGNLATAQFLDLLPVAVYVCDAPSGLIRFFNKRAVELWGRTPKVHDNDERFCGAFRLYRSDGKPMRHDETPMARALVEGTSTRAQEVVIERPDGSQVTVQVNIAPIKDSDGRIVGAVNIFQDVTERARLFTELQAERTRLRQTETKLVQRIGELEEFEQAVVGRELKMAGMERELAQLRELQKSGSQS